MRVLAVCAAPQSLQDLFLHTTLLSLFSHSVIHPPPASPPWQPVTENFCTPWIELRKTKRLDHPCEIVLFQNTFAASFCRGTPWTSVCERVLFIGTQFSILYTSVYPPAGAACQNMMLICYVNLY